MSLRIASMPAGSSPASTRAALVRCTFDTRISFRDAPGGEPRVLIGLAGVVVFIRGDLRARRQQREASLEAEPKVPAAS